MDVTTLADRYALVNRARTLEWFSFRRGGKSKGKRQKAKGKNEDTSSLHFCLLPFAFCLLPFDFSGYYDIGTDR